MDDHGSKKLPGRSIHFPEQETKTTTAPDDSFILPFVIPYGDTEEMIANLPAANGLLIPVISEEKSPRICI